eukprot:gene26814-33455_t
MVNTQWQLQYIKKLQSMYRGLQVTVLHITAAEDTIRSRILQRATSGGRVIPPALVERSLQLRHISAFKDFTPVVQQLIGVDANGPEPRITHPWHMTWEQLRQSLTPDLHTHTISYNKSNTLSSVTSFATTAETTESAGEMTLSSDQEEEDCESSYGEEQESLYSDPECDSMSYSHTYQSGSCVAVQPTITDDGQLRHTLPALKYHHDPAFERSVGNRTASGRISCSEGHNSVYKASLKQGSKSLSDPYTAQLEALPSRPSRRLCHSAPEFVLSSTQSHHSVCTLECDERSIHSDSSLEAFSAMLLLGETGGLEGEEEEEEGTEHIYRSDQQRSASPPLNTEEEMNAWSRIHGMTVSLSSSCTSSGVYSTHSDNILDGHSQLCDEDEEGEDCCTTGESVESVVTNGSHSDGGECWADDCFSDVSDSESVVDYLTDPFPSRSNTLRQSSAASVSHERASRSASKSLVADPTVSLVATFLASVDRDIRSLERKGASSMHFIKERMSTQSESHNRSWSMGSSREVRSESSDSCRTSIDSSISVNKLRKKSGGACLLCSIDGLGYKHNIRHPRCIG